MFEPLEHRHLMASLPYAAANISVLQNDNANTAASVTVTTVPGQATDDFHVPTGSNKGDYSVRIGPSAADDFSGGILITTVRENGRDNAAGGAPAGVNYVTSSVFGTGGLTIATAQAPGGGEYNIDVAAGYFPFAAGWVGGWAQNSTSEGPITALVQSGGIQLGPTLAFQQGVNGYTGAVDGLIHENGTANFSSVSAALDGPDGAGSPDIHGLLRFDNIIGTGAGQIPPNAKIISARLTVRTNTNSNAQSGGPFTVHQLLVPFDTTATWNSPFGGNGPDIAAGEIGTAVGTFADMTAGTRVGADVTAIVQNWANGQANLGFDLKAGNTSDGWNFDTAENATVANRPSLEIVYDNGDVGRFWELNGAPDGRYGLWLRDVNANTDGVLMVNSAMNGDNIALSRAMPTGYWNIISHDNGSNANDDEANPINFVYVPNGPGYVSGKFNGNEQALITNGSYTIRKTADGKYRLNIAGQTPATGTLLISPEGGVGNNVDNIVSYQASADGLGWDIETRDLPQSPPTLQAMTTDPVASFVFLPFAPAVVQGPIHAANIKVIQNDAGNDPTSVTVTTDLAIGDLIVRPGSNKGDYNVQIGNLATDDRNGGVLLTSVSENGRDNQGSGIKYTTATVDPGSGAMFIALHEAITSAGEFNTNVSAAYFSFADGWQGGWLLNSTNNGPITSAISNPPLTVSATAGANVVDSTATAGVYRLTLPGVNSQTDGVLLVNGAKNEDNYALAKAEADGSWTIYCIDNESNGGGGENDPVNFVFVPKSSTGYISGKFRGDGSLDAATTQADSTASVVNSSTGTYRLTIPGESPRSGILIISPEGGSGANVDNIVNFQADGDGWIIESRDIAASGPTVLENVGASDFVASFVFIPTPEVGLDALGNVIVTDVEGDADNAITVVRNGANVRISDANALLTAGDGATQIDLHTIEIPLANITGQINLSTLGGNDTVTIDYSGGSLPNIQYDGGNSATDGLAIKGSGTQTAIYTPAAGNAAQGAIISSAGNVFFTNSEAVDMHNLATATLQLPGVNDTLSIANGTNLVGNSSIAALQVSGSSDATTFAPVAFWNNGGVVIDTVSGGIDGNDDITVASAAVGNNTNLTITTGSGVDSVSINGAVALAGALNIATVDVNSTAAGTLSTSTSLTITQTGTASTLNGVISGATFTKNGEGTLLLLASNTYTGSTFLNAGTLQVGNGGTAGSIAAASVITIATPAKLVYFHNILGDNINNALSGAGQLSFVGTGVTNQSSYNIGGNNSGYTGQITVDKARLIVDSANDVGAASSIDVLANGQVFASGSFIVARPLNLTGIGWLESAGNLGALRLAGGANWSGNVTLTGDTRVTTYASGDSGSISGAIAGGFALTKTGTGPLTLAAANTFTGGLTNSGGTVLVTHPSALGTATYTVTTSAGGTFLDTTGLPGGLQSIANLIVLPNDSVLTNRAIYSRGGAGNTLQLSGVISGGGAFTTLFLNNNVADGNGIVRLSGNNTFVGAPGNAVRVNRGAIQIDSNAALGDSSNTLYLDSYSPNRLLFTNAMTYTHNTVLSYASAMFDTGANDVIATGILSGGQGLTKVGTGKLTLTGANSYTGATFVNEGTLQVGNGGVTGSIAAASAITVAAPAKLVYFHNILSDNINNAISGAGQLSFIGTGVSNESSYILGGNNSGFSGQIIVDKARLQFDSTSDVGATSSIDVLANGQIFASGNVTFTRLINLTGNGWLEPAGNLGALRLAGGANWSGNVTLTGNARVTTHSSGDVGTISGVISGPHQLEKTGAGTLTLSANNSYSGGTLHSGGILSITASGALGTGTFTFNGHNSLQAIVPDSANWTIANNIVLPTSGAGGDNELLRIGDGSPTAGTTLNLSGILSGGVLGQTYTLLDSGQTGNHNNVLVLSNAANTFSGTIEIWRGTLAFTSDGALGNLSNTIRLNAGAFNGGLRVDAAGITLAASRTLQLMGNESLNTQGFDIAIASTLTGSGRLRTSGGGNVSFTTPNSWTNGGGLEIQSGQVTTASQTLTSSRTVAIAAGSTLVSQGTLNFDNLTSAGSGRGGGTVVINGAGSLLLRNSASSANTPDILYSANGVGSSDYNAQIGVAVDLGASPRYINVNTNQNDGIDYGGDLQFNGVITGSGGLIINSAPSGSFNGSVGLYAANGFTGGLTIARGFVHLFATGALNVATPNAVSLTPAAGQTAGLYLYGRDATIGGLASSGAGAAVIRNGAYSAGMPAWIVPAAATLTIEQATDTVFAGRLSDGPTDDANNAPGGGMFYALNIVKAGAGVLRLTNDSTHTGTTQIVAGTLLIDGVFQGSGEITVQNGATLGGTGSAAGNITAQSGGTVSPGGTPGTLTTTGNTTLQSGEIYRVELIGLTNDSLVSNGVDLTDAVLDASSDSNLGASTPFLIIDNTSGNPVTGTFAGLPENASFFINGYQYFITYVYNGNDVAIIRNQMVDAIDDQFGPILVNTSLTANTYTNDSDPDGDARSTVIAQPLNGKVFMDPATGQFTYTPKPNFIGTDSFTYRLSDGEFNDTAIVKIIVAPLLVDGSGVLQVGGTTGGDNILVQAGSIRYNNTTYPLSASRVVVHGGGGNDTISVTASNIAVEFYGDDGDDYLSGGSLNDILDGGAGTDRLLGNAGDDNLYGGGGSDNLSGGIGNDYLSGDGYLDASSVELQAADAGKDTLSGDAGDDEIHGGAGMDTLLGGIGNDYLSGGEDGDAVDGGAGHDILLGGGGGDKLYGRAGNDVLIGGEGLDTLLGDTGLDLIYGGDVTASLSEATLRAIALQWFTPATQTAAVNQLLTYKQDDLVSDTLNGEADDDWYLLFAKDLIATTERFPGNRKAQW